MNAARWWMALRARATATASLDNDHVGEFRNALETLREVPFASEVGVAEDGQVAEVRATAAAADVRDRVSSRSVAMLDHSSKYRSPVQPEILLSTMKSSRPLESTVMTRPAVR